MPFPHDSERDRPWLMRTYAGHSSAGESNALYRRNLAKGQTGLSVAFDLPTQTGYDPDAELARGEVGKVGVPISHIGDLRTLFDGIPMDEMNTSMTINAPAMYMLALYLTVADEHAEAAGIDRTEARAKLSGTTQNDIIKEYLSRGTYVFPPGPSLRLITDMIAFTVAEVPKWNPINVCSYHLQEAGATPVQEVAFALCTAIAVLDSVRDSGQVSPEKFGEVVARISFFVNAGVRFIEEMCKLRAFGQLWDEITRERYGVENEKYRRFRYGVQVNSLGLTEAQPENNVYRILLEMLAVTMSKDARARAVQLPAWNEALGLPRAWDQQWSLRMQQVLAFESDLLEYEDLFEGSKVIEAKVAVIKSGAQAEIDRILEMGGAVAAVESGYLKSALVSSLAERRRRMESGEDVVVGLNKYTETEPNPLVAGVDGGILTVDPEVEKSAIAAVQAWRAGRNAHDVDEAITALRDAAKTDVNLMAASMACARVGVTVGEWAGVLREVFGEYRPPTGRRRSLGWWPGRGAGRRARAGRRRVRRARPSVEVPGRQAGPGRPFQRRGADRGPRARRRIRGRLFRDPADRRADRRGRGRGGRRRRRPLDPVRVAPVGGPRCRQRAARGRSRRRAGRGGRDHPRERRRDPAGQRRRPGVHAQGLRDHRRPEPGRRRDPRGTGLVHHDQLGT